MFDIYLEEIQSQYENHSESSELSYRTAFENMLNSFCDSHSIRKLKIKHEPKIIDGIGKPDYKVSTESMLTIGLIETKQIGENLNKTINTPQIAKYKQISDNIIITDYLNFYLIKNGELVLNIALCETNELVKRNFKLDKIKSSELEKLLITFFESEPETIVTVNDLAEKLSNKAILLREFSKENLKIDKSDSNKLFAMYNVFKETLLPQLETDYFADIYAQTLSYGLFLGGLNCNSAKEQMNKVTAYSLMPNSFSLIKELFHNLDDFPPDIVWAIDEIITILKVTDYVAIKKEFAEYRRNDMGFADPFIYFYEDFLKRYDKTQRELRGVYYTPEAVVSFIVRSTEEILKNTFEMNDGFANKNVTVLDFACGTGTFLLNIFKQALESASQFGNKKFVNLILNDDLINRFYGFELLVAPYVVAHLKISEFFKEEGYSLDEGKRLGVYLTNTLSNKEPKPFPFMPHLTFEGKAANRIKNENVLVVVGNPPYSVKSQNKNDFISNEKLNRYKTAVKNERNIQPLSDDYIKFIRFAHWKMEDKDKGVIGIISNNSYLDGLIHRGMREELLKDFDEIYIVNLHGNSRIGEKNIDGTKDENVFEIMQGVSIAIFVRKQKERQKPCKVFYKDLFGAKQAKYNYLWANSISTTDWIELNPENKSFYFSVKNFEHFKQYEKFIAIDEIFEKRNIGIATGKDIDFVKFRINQFEVFKHKKVKPYFYRPYDNRLIYYDLETLQRARYGLMQHIEKDNLVLALARRMRQNFGVPCLVTKNLVCRHSISDMTYTFPLYLYQDNKDVNENGNGYLFKEDNKKDNFTKKFRQFIKDYYVSKYDFSPSPEQIMSYIYAILYSDNYREKYFEFLKIDFPKIPFTDDLELFKELAKIGSNLIEHHLMRKSTRLTNCKFSAISDDFTINKVVRVLKDVNINMDCAFKDIDDEIWNYKIGGYNPLEKWLTERKRHNYTLNSDDIRHFIDMVDSIAYTIKTVEKINKLTENWI